MNTYDITIRHYQAALKEARDVARLWHGRATYALRAVDHFQERAHQAEAGIRELSAITEALTQRIDELDAVNDKLSGRVAELSTENAELRERVAELENVEHPSWCKCDECKGDEHGT